VQNKAAEEEQEADVEAPAAGMSTPRGGVSGGGSKLLNIGLVVRTFMCSALICVHAYVFLQVDHPQAMPASVCVCLWIGLHALGSCCVHVRPFMWKRLYCVCPLIDVAALCAFDAHARLSGGRTTAPARCRTGFPPKTRFVMTGVLWTRAHGVFVCMQ
jgi:hypothetical protein